MVTPTSSFELEGGSIKPYKPPLDSLLSPLHSAIFTSNTCSDHRLQNGESRLCEIVENGDYCML